MHVKLHANQKIKISTSADVWLVMSNILTRLGKIRQRKEYFWVMGLMSDNKIDFVELINIGSINAVYIEPREVFRISIIKNVSRVILVHNHPSGNTKPSESDKQLTTKMYKSGQMLGVEILDHIIITNQEYFSFKENDLL